MWLDGCSWLTGRFLLPEWLLMSPYWNVLICEVETLCLPARLVVPVSTDWRSVFVSCPAAFLPSLCSWTDPPVWALPWQVNGSLTIHPERWACSAPASEPAAGFIHCDVDVPLSPLLWSCECRSVQEQKATKRTQHKPETFLWFKPPGRVHLTRNEVISSVCYSSKHDNRLVCPQSPRAGQRISVAM